MSQEKEYRVKRITIRFTATEYGIINQRYQQTTCKVLNDYIRSIILNKPVVVKVRNSSLDDIMPVFILLKDELNGIGNNFNQLVKRLHMIQHVEEIKTWAILNENTRKILMAKIDEIKSKISSISDQWLQ
jgi:hypothetical protein